MGSFFLKKIKPDSLPIDILLDYIAWKTVDDNDKSDNKNNVDFVEISIFVVVLSWTSNDCISTARRSFWAIKISGESPDYVDFENIIF